MFLCLRKMVYHFQTACAAGKDHEATFALVEEKLRQRFPNHILPKSNTEWIFVNAGGWMGAMYVLHASLTEYILFFGTAIDTSGHSGEEGGVDDWWVVGGYYMFC